MAEGPLVQTSEKGYLGIIPLEMGILSVFYFYFFREGLRVIYNSDISEKSSPPYRV